MTSRRSLSFALAALSFGALATGQVRHRRPISSAPDIRYGFDNNSGSGCRDYNCGSRCYDGHRGTDFPVGIGTAVLASANGTVVATNNGCPNYGGLGSTCGGRCGNYVQVQHSDGTRTLFCHMQLNSISVRRGQRVTCGQQLGRSASSGNSSGPHLHLSWQRSGVSYDAFRGRCTSAPGIWTSQGSYPHSPGATCACVPSAETCNNRDDDCDGRVDDNLSRACYTGAASTRGRGVCRDGRQTCGSGRWGSCSGQTLPSAETCNNRDDDCDGRVDEGLSRECYTGPANTQGRGICRAGRQTCGAGRWGACSGQVVPRAEACNGMDDDCDGRVDEGVCSVDAGPPRDAGADVRDASTDAAVDVGAEDDAGFDDAAVGDDASVEDDAAVDDDASVGDDAAVDDDVVEFDDVPFEDDADVSPDDPALPEPDGCGCRAGAPRTSGWLGALGLGALVALVRRRRRR